MKLFTPLIIILFILVFGQVFGWGYSTYNISPATLSYYNGKTIDVNPILASSLILDYDYDFAVAMGAGTTIRYGAKVVDSTTGGQINDGAGLPIGARISLQYYNPNDNTLISWWGSGASSDSPYGTWNVGATSANLLPVMQHGESYCEWGGGCWIVYTYWVYLGYSVNPPTKTISTTNLSCSEFNGVSQDCTVTGAGPINISFNFSDTYSYFISSNYGRVHGYCNSAGAEDCMGDMLIPVPAQSINFSFTGFNPNSPPLVPTISGPYNVLSNVPVSFTVVSTDPDNDKIKYEIDFDGDSVPDLVLPASGFVNSGEGYIFGKIWTQTGSGQSFRARAIDSSGAVSGWSVHSIEVSTNLCRNLSPGRNTLAGPDNFQDPNYSPKIWTQSNSATALTPCLWKCNDGYVYDSSKNGCIAPEICDGKDNDLDGVVDEGCPFGWVDIASCEGGVFGWARDSRDALGNPIDYDNANNPLASSSTLAVDLYFADDASYSSVVSEVTGQGQWDWGRFNWDPNHNLQIARVLANVPSELGAHRFSYSNVNLSRPFFDPNLHVGESFAIGAFAINTGVLSTGNPQLSYNISNWPSGVPKGKIKINPEICDGKDNDCDGQIDEGFNVGNVCEVGVGECKKSGVFVCKLDSTASQCSVSAGAPTQEVCDGKDNDCDGQIDEGVGVCVPVSINACVVGSRVCSSTFDLNVCALVGDSNVWVSSSCGVTNCSLPHMQGSCSNTCSGVACSACTPPCAICVSGYNDCDGDLANGCEIFGVCKRVLGAVNSISRFDGGYDGNVNLLFNCLETDSDSNVTLFDYDSGELIVKLVHQGCLASGKGLVLNIPNLPVGKVVKAVLKINAPCSVCSRDVYLPITENPQTSPIPDNNLFFVLLTLIAVLFFVTNQKRD